MHLEMNRVPYCFLLELNLVNVLQRKKIRESGGNVEDAFQEFIDLKQKQNWGDISFPEIDVKGKTGSIKLENCFEAPTIGENAQCFFTRGFLSVFFVRDLSEGYQDF